MIKLGKIDYFVDNLGARFCWPIACSASNWDKQIDWLNKNCGELGKDWHYHRAKFYFSREPDAIMFRMIWL